MSQSNLNVKITATDLTKAAFNRLNDSLGDVSTNTRRAATEVAKLAGASGIAKAMGAAGIGGAAIAGAIGLERFADSWARSTVALSTQAKLLGTPIAKLDALGGAAAMAGSSADALGSGLFNLQKGMYDAAGGRDGGMAALLQTLGVNGSDAVKALGPIADAVKRANGPMDKLAIAVGAFGSAGYELLPFLDQGSKGIEALAARSKKYGTQTNDSVEASFKFLDAQQEIIQSYRKLKDTLLVDVAPSMGTIMREIAEGIHSVTPEMEAWTKNGGPERLTKSVKGTATEIKGLIDQVGGVKTASELLFAAWAAPGAISMLRTAATLAGFLTTATGALGLSAFALKGDQGPNSEVYGPPAPMSDQQRRVYDGAMTPGQWWRVNAPGWLGGRLKKSSSYEDGLANGVMQQLMGMGWSKNAAAAAAGNFEQESDFNPLASSGQYQGIAQWSTARRAMIEKHFGRSLSSMGLSGQVAAMDWEYRTKYGKSFSDLQGAASPGEAGSIFTHDYEAPLAMAQEMAMRGRLAERRFSRYGNSSEILGSDSGGKVDVHVHIAHAPGMDVRASAAGEGSVTVSPPRVARTATGAH